MAMSEITNALEKSRYFTDKLSALRSSNKISFPGLVGSSRSAVIAALASEIKNLLIITSSGQAAERLLAEMGTFGKKGILFPAPDIVPGEALSPTKELVGERLAILSNWSEGKSLTVVAPLKAVMCKTSRQLESIRISVNQNIRIDELIEKAINLGYRRFDIVGERGEFSVRGGIMDIFALNHPYPVRLEFTGDKIESLRIFDPFSQRSIENIAELKVFPAREKVEVPVFDHLPADAVIALDEVLELERISSNLQTEILRPAKDRRIVELSSFVKPGEEALFSSPPSYLGKLNGVPKASTIISRHAVRLKEELPEHNLVQGELRGGFIFEGLEVISDLELFGEEAAPRRLKPAGREGVADELLADLKIGDFIVHENYGIGIYRGMSSLEIEGLKQEYLLIEYAEGDKLYVPPHMIGLVEKYSGGTEARPRLSRLGTREWLRTRSRVKQSIRDMTRELLELYAAREKLEGFVFPPDDLWQKELEATFPFEETPDQIKAIIEVKKDMESPQPMDRLVCGDVGYGKTEVAIRAATKAVSAGKQVAVLAPTTILVEQHYNNFKQRFKNLPFIVEMLSRFRGAKEQKTVVKSLAAGAVDVVIGTHRLLSKDINFKDLGLVIIDEEQKFGVAHKEKLKKLKKTVDVLTLTATPIPRTLYFSLSGAREMSMISTPPADRSPIRTYVLPFSETVIREAILRELDRGGQIYFVHNFVETITGAASKIKKLVPEARVAIGHGRMDEKKLEKTMLDFLERKYDVLVCTSIIESGLDIPNVNTILIDHADRFGLSQLYQIRGRVGRSAARAYAYLFYHPARSMTDQAVERLKAIQEFTALGSGYKLAMRDLEIRGSGNLLGAEQSGHIYEVGFDLYVELLEEAVKELKGEPITPHREIIFDLKVEAYIPESYITDEKQRIAIYRRMNNLRSRSDVEELRKELIDRFGKTPEKLEKLFNLLQLKVDALNKGVKSVKEEKGVVMIEWHSGKRKQITKEAILKKGIP